MNIPITPPIVLCIDFASYVAAVAAIETLAGQLPDSKDKLMAASKDLRRAYTAYSELQSTVMTGAVPALLKRQAE